MEKKLQRNFREMVQQKKMCRQRDKWGLAPLLQSRPPGLLSLSFPLHHAFYGRDDSDALVPPPEELRTTDDKGLIRWPEIPPIEASRMVVEEQDFVIIQHAAAAPDGQRTAFRIFA